MHPYHRLPGVVVGQRIGHRLRRDAERRQIQRDHRFHTGVVVGHDRHKVGRGVQPRDGGHLRQVLVVQRQTVGARGVQRRVDALALVLGNHLFAAAAVAGQACDREVRSRGDKPPLHQRRNGCNKPGGMAAGHRHAGGGRQRRAGAVQLRQAVDPAGGCAVCCAGVQNPHITAHQRHDLARGVIGQAEEGEVALIDDRCPGADILAVCLGDFQNFKFIPLRQPVRNAQAGGTGTSIHENFVLSHTCTPDY